MTYRNTTRLAPGEPRSTPLSAEDWEAITVLYARGETDLTIAADIGCSSKTIARWRKEEGLPRNDRATSKEEK